jgi:tetratricopeptide (TPR) repeat protein
MDDRRPDELRYTAFLSYSHKDAAAAGRLHRRLETYRVPRRLVGTETPRGPVPARLAPIFRDREELPAATDLSETVREALAQSGALIVLCSPSAAESLWVAEEIETFRRIHPDRPVLAAVLDGDPPDCFPQVLRALGRDGAWHEPLATDLRRHRDGRRLGLLKLVAGITGVGLDALVQRDAARRIRRVMAVTGAAVIAMLAMAAMVVVALNARGEAERQRAEAEGLTQFMLIDLHDKLEGVGRLDIMRAVNQRALAHYDLQIQRGDDSAATLLQRARILHGLGEQDILQGDLGPALARFAEARRITVDQVARHPDDRQALFAHSQGEYWIGHIYELRGNWPAAERQFRRFSALAERLVAAAPDNPDYTMQAGASAVALGNVQLNGLRDYAAAERFYGNAVSWFEQTARARPRDGTVLFALANAYGWLGDSFFMRRMWPQSLDARLKQYPILEQLYLADPANAVNGYRLALAQRALARLLPRSGQRARARRLMYEAYDWSNHLTHLDPRNADWLLFRAFVGCELYHGEFGPPAGVTRAQLGRDIRYVDRALRNQNNPRFADFANCVNALN